MSHQMEWVVGSGARSRAHLAGGWDKQGVPERWTAHCGAQLTDLEIVSGQNIPATYGNVDGGWCKTCADHYWDLASLYLRHGFGLEALDASDEARSSFVGLQRSEHQVTETHRRMTGYAIDD